MGIAASFVTKMRELGYAEPANLAIDWCYAQDKPERLPALARELVDRRVDVIVAIAGSAVRAAKQATAAIPIVIYGNFDPVEEGYVASLARPGGNLTGVLIAPEGTLGAKKLELLKEAVPRATRVAFLAPSDPGATPRQFREVERAASALGVTAVSVTVNHKDYDGAFKSITAMRADALFVAATTYFSADRKPIIRLALKHRLPTIWEWREQVVDGGLMAYGSSLAVTAERLAAKVDLIARGAQPSELAIEQPRKLSLVVNAKTAKAIGLALSPTFLARADEAIQ